MAHICQNSPAVVLYLYVSSACCCWFVTLCPSCPLCLLLTFLLCIHIHLISLIPVRVHRHHFSDRAFQVAGPRLWNSLPASLRQSDTTVGQFKKLLKTHLFSWNCGPLVTVALTAPCINISTTTTTTTILSPHITHFLFHSRLKTYLFNRSLSSQTAGTYRSAFMDSRLYFWFLKGCL